jgi:hypothetical protein
MTMNIVSHAHERNRAKAKATTIIVPYVMINVCRGRFGDCGHGNFSQHPLIWVALAHSITVGD